MKILVITALYPPHHLGGYELRSQNVIDRLRARGHEIQVVTSTFGVAKPESVGHVTRILHLEPSTSLWQRIRWDVHDLRFIDRTIAGFQPDIVYLWHMAELARTFFPFLARRKIPIVYDEGGNGLMLAWQNHGRWIGFCEGKSSHFVKGILKRSLCRMVSGATGGLLPCRWSWPSSMQVYFNSQQGLDAARAAGLPLNGAQVIHSGVDTRLFVYQPRFAIGTPLRLVLPGRVVRIKGVHDGIAVLVELARLLPRVAVTLDVVGPTTDADYLASLKRQARDAGVADQINFVGAVSHTVMADLYRSSDICLFPSHQPFGLSRIPLEAMASGTVVIASGNEGSSELISDGQTGFLVPVGDPVAVAQAVIRLHNQADLFSRISAQAHKVVAEKFAIERVVARIEQVLLDAASGGSSETSIG